MITEPSILVVGSINMDLVVRTPHMPAAGETVLGDSFTTSPGGKGANQSVAAARLGARCRMIGRVGDDEFAGSLRAGLEAEGIDCRSVTAVDGCATGVAMIVVDAVGENSIVVASGANFRLTPADLQAERGAFDSADVVLVQLELPVPTVVRAVELAKEHGCRVVLDPAPARANLQAALFQVDVFSPNVSEAAILLGPGAGGDGLTAKSAAEALLARGVGTAVMKLGGEGAYVAAKGCEPMRVKAFDVELVDTVGAGDAFTAALAVAIARDEPMDQAVRFACAAGALACTKRGAQQAMPTAERVRELMGRS